MAGIEPTKGGPLNWSGLDQAVARAARNRLELLPAIWGSPSWVAKTETTLPVRTAKQRGAWMAFLKKVVNRYGPSGSFWAANPSVPRRPIRIWQDWNEENFFYFAKRPSPTQYAKLVKISHKAITSADRGAQVILGGMFALPVQRPPKAYTARRFLDLMYKRSPGIKRSFDGVALHPYSRSYIYLKATINQVRAVMRRHHDNRTGLWITEVGWGSGHGNNSFEKGRRGQVRQLKGAFKVFRNNRRKWHLKRIYWFSLDDLAGTCNFCDSTGLFGAGLQAETLLARLRQVRRRQGQRWPRQRLARGLLGREGLRRAERRSAALRAPGRLAVPLGSRGRGGLKAPPSARNDLAPSRGGRPSSCASSCRK